MNRIRLPKLPTGLHWFTVNRQRVFPCYGASGGLAGARIAIIIHHLAPQFYADFGDPGYHDSDSGKWFRFDFPEDATQSWINVRVKDAVALLTAD